MSSSDFVQLRVPPDSVYIPLEWLTLHAAYKLIGAHQYRHQWTGSENESYSSDMVAQLRAPLEAEVRRLEAEIADLERPNSKAYQRAKQKQDLLAFSCPGRSVPNVRVGLQRKRQSELETVRLRLQQLPTPDDDAVERHRYAVRKLRDLLVEKDVQAYPLIKLDDAPPYPQSLWLHPEAALAVLSPGKVDMYQLAQYPDAKLPELHSGWIVVRRADLECALNTPTKQAQANKRQSHTKRGARAGRKPAEQTTATNVEIARLFDEARSSLTFKRGEFTVLAKSIANEVGLKSNTVEGKIRPDYKQARYDARKKVQIEPD